jgi:hypothetical protein
MPRSSHRYTLQSEFGYAGRDEKLPERQQFDGAPRVGVPIFNRLNAATEMP